MNTQVSIEVPEAAETALSAAYEALLSMGRCPKWARPSIDPALLYAQRPSPAGICAPTITSVSSQFSGWGRGSAV